MTLANAISIIFASVISENILLFYFLGTCPLISLSRDPEAAFNMGVAVTFVTTFSAAANFALDRYLLGPLGLQHLRLLFYIVVIAALTQALEMFLDRFLPAVYVSFGIFMPLLAVNCAILGVSIFASLREYSFAETSLFAFGSGVGWLLVVSAMAAIKRRIPKENIPPSLGETGMSMVIAAMMAMSFWAVSQVFKGVALS